MANDPQDLIDSVLADQPEQQQAAPAAPAEPPPQTMPDEPKGIAPPAGGDLIDSMVAQDHETGIDGKASSWWSWADKSILDTATGGWVPKQLASENEIGQKIIDREIASAHPWRAALAQFYYGSMKDAGDLAMELTTPKNLAIQIATMGEGSVAQALKLAANTYFVSQGAKAMVKDHGAFLDLAENAMKGKLEADPVKLQQFLYGASAVASGVGGAKDAGEASARLMRGRVQEKLGISGDLAAKVAQKIQDIDALRRQGAQAAAGEVLSATQDITDTFDQAQKDTAQAQGLVDMVNKAIPARVSQMLADAVHAVHLEKGRVEQPFAEMAAQADEPVSTAKDVRGSIIDVLENDHKLQPHEVPPKIFNALFRRGKSAQPGAPEGFEDLRGGGIEDQINDELADQNITDETDNAVSFHDMTRVRGDLYDAAQGAKDPHVRYALFDAYETITEQQQSYADEHGFGDQYTKAKQDYAKFKRELGSGQMAKFTKAADVRDQSMAPRVAQITRGVYAESLRKLLDIAGVDTKPLDRLMDMQETVKKGMEDIPKRTAKDTSKRLQQGVKAADKITAQTEKQANVLGKTNPAAPGLNDLNLQGKTTEQIRQEAIDHLVANSKAKGISDPMGMFMVLYGAARMAMGSVFGGYLVIRGGSRVLSQQGWKTLRNPSFQDWVIRESGVSPTNSGMIGKLRKGLTVLSNTARIQANKNPDAL